MLKINVAPMFYKVMSRGDKIEVKKRVKYLGSLLDNKKGVSKDAKTKGSSDTIEKGIDDLPCRKEEDQMKVDMNWGLNRKKWVVISDYGPCSEKLGRGEELLDFKTKLVYMGREVSAQL